MTVNEKIIQCLEPLELPVVPDIYEGEKEEYITFNYADNRGTAFGDDAPLQIMNYMQIHLFLPLSMNYLKKQKQIRELLFMAGFSFPEITVIANKEEGNRHIIFECSIEEEEEWQK